MNKLLKIDTELYAVSLISSVVESEQWKKVKDNNELLREAMELEKDAFGEDNIVKGISICDAMLRDYMNVDPDLYQELINLIFSNETIARIVVEGSLNGGKSYLYKALLNTDLKLTDEQKAFALKEAMNKIGTVEWLDKQKDLEEEVLDMNPTSELFTNKYWVNVFSGENPAQVHGRGAYDIRYLILRNPNWTDEEKDILAYDFWANNNEYDSFLEAWESGIVNTSVNYKEDKYSQLNKNDLYSYDYETLLKFYNKDKRVTDIIWDEIQFCFHMHAIRPEQYELGPEKYLEEDF